MPGTDPRGERRLLRISELAAITEVPPASIKFYIKEGLLPPPVKTSRNMAYYDETFIERIRFIKQLQAEHFLPLRIIREILTQGKGNGKLDETRALLDLKGYFLGRPVGEQKDPLPEPEVIRRYNTYKEELEDLRTMGILKSWEEEGERMYGGDDLAFLEALENNRRLGFTSDIGFQVKDLAIYLEALEVLAKEEVNLLISRTASKLTSEEIHGLAERGIREFGPLLMILRRKMILKVLAGLHTNGSDLATRDGNGTRHGEEIRENAAAAGAEASVRGVDSRRTGLKSNGKQ